MDLNRGNFKMTYESAANNLLGIITYIQENPDGDVPFSNTNNENIHGGRKGAGNGMNQEKPSYIMNGTLEKRQIF